MRHPSVFQRARQPPPPAAGMGVGHVHGRLARRLARNALGRLHRTVVRDADSAMRIDRNHVRTHLDQPDR